MEIVREQQVACNVSTMGKGVAVHKLIHQTQFHIDAFEFSQNRQTRTGHVLVI